jgi:hypothetical protein
MIKNPVFSYPGTSIKRGGLGCSVKCPKSNLQPLFQVGYVMEFGEHSTNHPLTKFQPQILMYVVNVSYIHCYKSANRQPSLVLLHKRFGQY